MLIKQVSNILLLTEYMHANVFIETFQRNDYLLWMRWQQKALVALLHYVYHIHQHFVVISLRFKVNSTTLHVYLKWIFAALGLVNRQGRLRKLPGHIIIIFLHIPYVYVRKVLLLLHFMTLDRVNSSVFRECPPTLHTVLRLRIRPVTRVILSRPKR